MNMTDIIVRHEDGVFKVPADFNDRFKLVPRPSGNLNLVFWERSRMRKYLKTFGYIPMVYLKEGISKN